MTLSVVNFERLFSKPSDGGFAGACRVKMYFSIRWRRSLSECTALVDMVCEVSSVRRHRVSRFDN
jgi:hypothetical protein